MFLAKKTNILTISGLKEALAGETIWPDVLKRRSEAQLVAYAQRIITIILLGVHPCFV